MPCVEGHSSYRQLEAMMAQGDGGCREVENCDLLPSMQEMIIFITPKVIPLLILFMFVYFCYISNINSFLGFSTTIVR